MTLAAMSVVGARPNFPKLAPVSRALERRGLRHTVVHTGQHYDPALSDVFFRDLELRPPDVHLGVGSGSHARQTGAVLQALEPVLEAHRPDWLLVYGDVNSCVAAALAAAKLGIAVAHVEAGLRSFDRSMPEELNRVVTDQLSELLLTPSAEADVNLVREGIAPWRIERVGNVMIDTLLRALPAARARATAASLGLAPRGYAVATLHRPSNVDAPEALGPLLGALARVADRLPVVFPAHPRTRARLPAGALAHPGLRVVEPMGYLDFLSLTADAALVLTDSGGLQEETAVLGVPCLTLRENTERPVTVTHGTNRVIGVEPERVVREALEALGRTPAPGALGDRVPPLWDGQAGERVADALLARAGAAR